jgi:hypothetical protein
MVVIILNQNIIITIKTYHFILLVRIISLGKMSRNIIKHSRKIEMHLAPLHTAAQLCSSCPMIWRVSTSKNNQLDLSRIQGCGFYIESPILEVVQYRRSSPTGFSRPLHQFQHFKNSLKLTSIR